MQSESILNLSMALGHSYVYLIIIIYLEWSDLSVLHNVRVCDVVTVFRKVYKNVFCKYLPLGFVWHCHSCTYLITEPKCIFFVTVTCDMSHICHTLQMRYFPFWKFMLSYLLSNLI
jgi:hypothetical protein